MSLFAHMSGRRSIVFIAVGLTAFVLYLWFFVGFQDLIDFLSRLNVYDYSLYYSIAIVAVLGTILFDSMAWHELLKALRVKIGLKRVILYNWIGNFVELVIPCETVCGEVTRIYLSQKDSGNDVGTTAASVVSARIIDTVLTMGGLAIGSLSLVLTHNLPVYMVGSFMLVSAATLIAITAIIFIVMRENASKRIVNGLVRVAKVITKNRASLDSRKKKIEESFQSFSQSFNTFKEQPKLLIKPVLFAGASWFCNVLIYIMVLYALNFRGISLIDATLVYSVAMTVGTVTAGVPVGVVEITMINLYSLVGVPLVVAGAATTLTRVLTFWIQITVGYPVAQWMGIKHLNSGNASEKIQ